MARIQLSDVALHGVKGAKVVKKTKKQLEKEKKECEEYCKAARYERAMECQGVINARSYGCPSPAAAPIVFTQSNGQELKLTPKRNIK
ncbi:MAG: hypothetical protein J5892_04090 [Bacilli bacterium]|nr:hypothetical protein [Bacilli bacterium]